MSLDAVFFLVDLRLAAVVLIAIMLLATEIGFRVGRRSAKGADEGARSQATVFEGSTLGVLGLLLAFTFSMSVARFDSRKRIVVDETNALGTAYLRAQLLPEPDRGEVQASLRSYVDTWLELHRAGMDLRGIQATMSQLNQIQESLWSRTAALARQDPHAVTLSLLLQALNDVFDRQSELMASATNRVPGPVLLLLILASVVSLWIVGRGCGLLGFRSFGTTLVFCCMLATIILVILDLDRPRRGLVQIAPQGMIALRASMAPSSP